MASVNWLTGVSADWNTATDWSTLTTVPTAADDVTIDAVAPPAPGYTVTIGRGETVNVKSLSMNGTNNRDGVNTSPYDGAALELDGTLAFGPALPGSLFPPGSLGGSLQTFVHVAGGESASIVNGGTLDGFIQVEGNLTFTTTGTTGVYIMNDIQALSGTVTIDTPIAELDDTTLFDGIFDAKGSNALIQLGGVGHAVTINTIEGPPTNESGWTQLSLDGPAAAINEWNGTNYVSILTSLNDIKGGGTVDLMSGAGYTLASGQSFTLSTHTLTVEGGNGPRDTPLAAGVLNLQAGTVNVAEIDINSGGIVQGSGTVSGNVVNNGLLMAVNGTLAVAGSLTGIGAVKFDVDAEQNTLLTNASTLEVHAVSAGQTVTMNGRDTLQLDTPSAFAGTVSALAGDKIVLQGVTVTNTIINGGSLVLKNGAATVGSITLGTTYEHEGFTASVVDGNTTLTAGTPPAGASVTGLPPTETDTDNATIAPFAGVTVSDLDTQALDSATIVVTAGGIASDANGVLSGTGLTKSAAGTYTLAAATPASLSAELTALTFTPTAHQVAAGSTVATGFGLTVVGSSTATANTTLTVTAQADPPVVVPPVVPPVLPVFPTLPTIPDAPVAPVVPTLPAAPVAPVVTTPANFLVTDNTTGVTTGSAGSAYTGPVPGLQLQYTNLSADNLYITATAPNAFIHSGAGDDGIDVSKAGGNNVLDGSTGSNFLIGGGGNDSFFVDDRAPTAAIWSTIANFHAGDSATFWGVSSQDFSLSWLNNQGAAGYTGLTLNAIAPGKPIATMTLAGYSTADLTNGRLTVLTGRDPTTGGAFLYVHGN
jgi:hypothetical protein